MVTPEPTPGTSVGPYRIDSARPRDGRAGQVFLATDQRLGRTVTLEVVVGALADDAAFVRRFEDAAAATATIESLHVVQVYDHGVEDGMPYVASQYAAGGDLAALLARRGPLPLPLAAQVCAQVAEALRDAHRAGIVHGDLKPGHVLLRDDPDERVHVLVSGFGSGLLDAADSTRPASAPGAWNYLAPERLQGGTPTESGDVYAVGCLLHELTTGRAPYTGSDVEVAMAHLDAPVPELPGDDDATRRLNEVLAHALAKDPADRTASAADLRGELRAFAGLLSSPRSTPPGPVPLDAMPPPTSAPVPAPASSPHYQSLSVPQAAAVPGPEAPPSDDRRGSRRATVIAAAVVVGVLVVAGVVVGVVAGGGDGGDQDDPNPGPSTSAPTTAVPAADGPVTGDLDGDGFGDVALIDSAGLHVLASDGSTGFGDETLRGNRRGSVGLIGDLDGDEEVDLVRIEGDPPRMTALVAGKAVSPITTPRSAEVLSALDVPLALGDVDGDGDNDLVAVSRLSDSRAQADVALGDGTGAFAPPVTWWTGDVPDDELDLALADVDKDGSADMVLSAYDFSTFTGTAVLLRSQDATFVLEGDPITLVGGSVDAADLDGDGFAEIVELGDGPDFTMWSYEGGTIEQVPWFENPGDQIRSAFRWVASDVNGDGFDDAVTFASTTDGGYAIDGVYLSDGEKLTEAPGWARPLPALRSFSPLDSDTL